MKITGVLLIGMTVCLQGCVGSEDSHATLTAQLTPIQIPSTTPTQTPIPLTFDLSMASTPWTGYEFNRSDAILLSVSGGVRDSINIFIENTDGSQFECVVCNGFYPDILYSPAWSPDGTMYAYVAASYLSNRIMIRREDMTEVDIISSSDKWYDDVAWSPDGRYIAFSTSSGIFTSSVCYMEVDLSHPENAEKHCVTPEKSNKYPSWSPDSKKIVFSAGAGNGGTGIYNYGVSPANLYIWDVDNQNTIKFTDTSNAKLIPKWSPDASKLAYILRDNTTFKYSLWVANADDTGQARIGGDEDIYDFDWSPDGRKIVFTQRSSIENDWCDAAGCLPYTILKIINLDTGTTSNLTDGTFWIGDPAWKP